MYFILIQCQDKSPNILDIYEYLNQLLCFRITLLADDEVVSRKEFDEVWMKLLHQMKEISMAEYSLAKMYDHVDVDKNRRLTSTELAGILTYMDADSKLLLRN